MIIFSNDADFYFSGFANILSSVSESLKTLAQEEAPSPDNHHAEVSASSPIYDRRRVSFLSYVFEDKRTLVYAPREKSISISSYIYLLFHHVNLTTNRSICELEWIWCDDLVFGKGAAKELIKR